VDFTREPIIETIITPKEGCKLVVRSSKSASQEEYFVEALEIVSFGHSLFFRSLERPKAFIVPVSDYEVLEVREARMVLKNAGLDRSIKIGGGREGGNKAAREQEKVELFIEEDKDNETTKEEAASSAEAPADGRSAEPRLDKKRDRRRNYRKRRGRDDKEDTKEEVIAIEPILPALEDDKVAIAAPLEGEEVLAGATGANLFSSLLQPPPTLISETINRYRENALFKNAFFLTEEEQYKPHDKVQDLLNEDDENEAVPHLQEPTFAMDASSAEEDPDFFDNRSDAENSSPLADSLAQEEEEKEGLTLVQREEFFEISDSNSQLTFFSSDQIEEESALPLFAEEEAIEKNGDEEEPMSNWKNEDEDPQHPSSHQNET